MADSTDTIIPMLHEIRAETAGLHNETMLWMDQIEQRLVRPADDQVAITDPFTARWSPMRLRSKAVERHLRFLENQS